MSAWISTARDLSVRALMRAVAGGAAAILLATAYWLYAIATDGQVQRLGALLTPAVAMLALAIGYAQWRIAQNKLKLDLFDRRHAVYAAALEAINRVISLQEPDDDFLDRFRMGTAGVKWLFGPEVHRFVWSELAPILHGYDMVRLDLRELDSIPPERRENLLKSKASFHKLGHGQLSRIDEVFEKYLTLSH